MEKAPVEIVLEICSHLDPRDLLHVARSAKIFARSLLGSSAAGVWKAARKKCEPDLPPIHPDLTEQKYALLGFGSHCQNCGTPTRSAVNWYLRKRWCLRCQSETLDSKYCHLPIPWVSIRGHPKHDLIVYQARLSGSGGRDQRRDCRDTCPVSELEALEWKAQEFSDAEWDAYVAAQKQKKKALQEHARLCTEWTKKRISDHQAELYALRCEREEAVKSRLEGIGYSIGLIDLAIDSGFTGLGLSKPLTDKGEPSVTLIAG
ncbi:uncharacterized protein EI90DRAFT_2612827 [Cantharellus anzutake]|uniref:uncharacterized protein n=1 Tax=Cantharellus anzutake TaxID=1750568 RepID=UPI001906D0C4|nr:uncharacterized protein EI90DRAFT_2612827 [Cantharellus anzutake]KAF8320177.1 hypothetical protein EI90DRAFT_2612827 [Cantharellus anzutake]